MPLSIHCTISVSERIGVSELIAKALSELVEKRPEDPLSYLAKQYPLLCRLTVAALLGLRKPKTPVMSLFPACGSDLIFPFLIWLWSVTGISKQQIHALLETYICMQKYFRSRAWPWGTPITRTIIVFVTADCRISQSYVLQGIAHACKLQDLIMRFCNYIPTLHELYPMHKNVVLVKHHEYTQIQLHVL